MSLGEGFILGSSTFGSPPLSNIDDLGLIIPTGVYHKWDMQSIVTHTTNDVKTIFTYTIPDSITGDCLLNFKVYRVSYCTVGTCAGSMYSVIGNLFTNRDGGVLATPSSWPGSVRQSYLDVSTGIANMVTTSSKSGNTLNLLLTGIASQTVISKVLAHVQIVSTP